MIQASPAPHNGRLAIESGGGAGLVGNGPFLRACDDDPNELKGYTTGLRSQQPRTATHRLSRSGVARHSSQHAAHRSVTAPCQVCAPKHGHRRRPCRAHLRAHLCRALWCCVRPRRAAPLPRTRHRGKRGGPCSLCAPPLGPWPCGPALCHPGATDGRAGGRTDGRSDRSSRLVPRAAHEYKSQLQYSDAHGHPI